MVDLILKKFKSLILLNVKNPNFYMIKLLIVSKEARRSMENQKKHNNEDNSFVSINIVQ
jgi:hypothetical protein